MGGLCVCLLGCGETNTGPGASPPEDNDPCADTFADHHYSAFFAAESLLVYRDNGTICACGELVVIDPSLAGIWVLNPLDGSRRRLQSFGHDPSLTPDGRVLVYAWQTAIYARSLDGASLPEEISHSNRNTRPAISRTGRYVAWNKIAGDDAGLRVYDRVSKKLTALIGSGLADPDWHPSEDRLLCRQGNDIVTYGLDSGEVTVVRSHSGLATLSRPRYSPGADRVAFVLVGPTDTRLMIRGIGERAAGDREVFRRHALRGPTWAPDGLSLVVQVLDPSLLDEGHSGVLWSVPLNGDAVPLTTPWAQCDPDTLSRNGN